MQELKGPLKNRKQHEHVENESMNALSTWTEVFNELKRRHFI